MYPFIHIGDITYPTFALAQALGITCAFFLSRSIMRRDGYSFLQSTLLFLLVLASLWVGGRIGHIVMYGGGNDFSPFQDNGTSILGSITMIIITTVIYIKLIKRDWRPIADVVAICLLVAQAFGKAGCFFAGCCFGTHTDLPWGIMPEKIFAPHTGGFPIHPVQLYELLGLILLIAALSLSVVKKRGGATAGFYLAGYGMIRFLAEFFRGDAQPFHIGLTNGQTLAMILILCGALLLFRIYRRPKQRDSEQLARGKPIPHL